MESDLQTKVDLYIETLVILKKEYKWSIGDLTLRFIALVYILSNKTFDKYQFDEMVKYIKKNSKWYSNYRGHQMYSTAALLITKFDDPQKAFTDQLEYEKKMKDEGFKNSSYLSIASYTLLLTCTPESIDSRIHKAIEIYKEMKKNHFWLTTSDDYPVAVLLAESDKKIDILISDMESNYEMLNKEGLKKSNGLQFLSHLLTFIPEAANTKAQRVKWIYDKLKSEKLRVSSTYYGTLGYIALIGEFSKQATEDVIDTVSYLKSNKNFKWINKEMNILVATAIVTNQYIEDISKKNNVIEAGINISIESIIAAQTAALIATTSAAASSSAASSGN